MTPRKKISDSKASKNEDVTQELPAQDLVEAAKAPEPKAEVPESDPEPEKLPEAKMAMPVELPKFRVKKDWRGSYRGNITYFQEGRIVNPRSYGGMPGIEGMLKAGIELEEIK